MENIIQKKVNSWLSENYDEETKNEIRRLQQENEAELIESFYKDLEFGTGGLRGIMGVGTNRMNKYTIGKATQGLANYIKLSFPCQAVSVAISFDSRINSRYFADITADILSANDIHCFLFSSLRPTPELSFAVRHFHCHAGVMITASHNPKEYNGYKVYWEDGGQLVPPHDHNVIDEVNRIDSINHIKWKRNEDIVTMIGEDVDKIYLESILSLSQDIKDVTKEEKLSIVYTPLHGAGCHLVPEALKMFGFNNVFVVESQATPDGNFPTVQSPNPEEKSALTLALKKADEVQADLVLATDPDGDRVGIAIRDNHNQLMLLNGNQTGSLLIYYLLLRWQEHKKINGSQYIVKTIVTTDLIAAIGRDFLVNCEEVLTGFKYIAEKIREHEKTGDAVFIAGGEESYGYLIGDFVRDKDAVSACCLIAEMTSYFAKHRKSLYDILLYLYKTYGLYKEELLSITKKGKKGAEEIKTMMENYRNNPPEYINGKKVIMIKDYLYQKIYNNNDGNNSAINLPKSDVLQFVLEDQSKISIRPSGTEPKIKFYFGVVEPLQKESLYEKTNMLLKERIQNIIKSMHL